MITTQLNNDPEELTTSLNFSGNHTEETESDQETAGGQYKAELIPDNEDSSDEDLYEEDHDDDLPIADRDVLESNDPDDSEDLDDTDKVSPDEAANEDEALENEPLDEEV
jgi:hypothetical protein